MSLIEKAAAKLKKNESLVERAAKKEAATSQAPTVTEPVESSPATPPVHAPKADAEQKKTKRSSTFVEVNLDLLREQGIHAENDDVENSVTAEEFRIVKRSLLLNAFSKGESAIENGNIIMVTSTQPNEGKTFCATSLAMSMAAERDLTVLLVDADVAKPDVLKTLGVKGNKGLIDVIENKDMDLSECLLRTNIPNFTILPAGKKHKLTTELLASGRMGEIIDEIARRYSDRVIIIDSPPVLASSAASVLALHVGQILYVVEAERTREGELKDALKMIEKNKNVNFLLNKTRFTPGTKKFGSYYGYGYN
ncbi:XrtA-associated tyrosine autokinase [Paremcibacter congregatus]|uniref:non-specific protein-tyrosine kinase n=1 Tax=Paremcibacter congregatus TaxID=2043170 RepID=A0A2G4YUY5_9PROT|nr:XrtA-associated tyrosine autokinase [Paremcibacter congregatus]PHZ86060.1 protein tyrosine kinase [Paremcibacter congregatus]QDE27026.1 protein tyrosine kinase [Paremcibacter congregatus]|tara:strand:- start:12219 stop:13145 length:927 start_codon:yes stop_codon:yes gene_type:complete